MAKTLKTKSKKSLKKWECQYGCDLSKKMCKHLDNMLPSIMNGAISGDVIEEYMVNTLMNENIDERDSYEDLCNILEGDLKALDFNPTEVSLLMDRFISGLTIKELGKKYGADSSSIFASLANMKQTLSSSGLLTRLKTINNFK